VSRTIGNLRFDSPRVGEGARIGAHAAARSPRTDVLSARLGLFAMLAFCACVCAFAAHAASPDANARFARGTDATAPATDTFSLAAPGVSDEPLRIHVRVPRGYARALDVRYPTLYVNDGQDWDAVGFEGTLTRLERGHAIRPVLVVAIDMPPDRMGAYGLSDRAAGRSVVGDSRFGPIGARAQAYVQWLTERLVPEIDARYRTRAEPPQRAILGWSLGALNAFDLGWQYPDVFGTVGAFSPSFWVASDRSGAAAAQRTRLAQAMVDAGTKRDGSRFWFAIGDREETDDRDGDGVNDAVDDLRDLILGTEAADGKRAHGLAGLGYRIDMHAANRAPTEGDVAYFELRGGRHEQASWKRMLPAFLTWAFPAEKR